MIDKNASLLFELRQHDFFASMSDDTMEELLALTQTKTIKSRQAIFRCGRGYATRSQDILLASKSETAEQGGAARYLSGVSAPGP